MQVYGAEFIAQLHPAHRPIVHVGDEHVGGLHQLSAEGDALGAVVVAGDIGDRAALQVHPREKPVEQGHRLRRRHGPVVNIPADEGHIRAAGKIKNLVKDDLLILEHGHFVHALSQMQIGDVQKLHGGLPLQRDGWNYYI